MPLCVHGDICRAWMKKFDYPRPLSSSCPSECLYFKEDEPSDKKKSDKKTKIIKRKAVPLFGVVNEHGTVVRKIKLYDYFINLIDNEDYEIERVDRIDSSNIVYILKKK